MASPEDGTSGLTEPESLRPAAASPVSEKESRHHALLVGKLKLARFVCSQECKTCSY